MTETVPVPPTQARGGGALFERDRELAALSELMDAVGDGQASFALVEGYAGIGKSRLLGELRDRAASEGWRLLGGRGSELEREFPFGVVRQLFEPALVDPELRERWLAGSAQAALPVFESLAADGGEDGRDASFAALHGLYWLVANAAAEGPLVLAIDDLHWCDRSSLRFVAYLLRRLEGLPVLVAATLRTAEPGTDAALLADIAHDPLSVSVHPGPLSEEGTLALVRERLGEADERFARACHGATGGNPLLLRQLLTSLRAEGTRGSAANADVVRDIGPRAVSRTVLLRLGRLPADAAAVARAVAVLGESADLPAVAALAEMSEARVAQATGELARAEILRPEPPLGFVHPLVRDAVYHELSPGDRELQHARAAQLLMDAGAAAQEVAAHLLVVPRRGESWVAELLYEAGRGAVRKGAPDSAASYFERALEEPPPPELEAQLLLELGVAETHLRGPEAAEHLAAAYERLQDPRQRALVGTALARMLLFTGRAEEARVLACEVGKELPAELSDERQAARAAELMSFFFGAGELELLHGVDDYAQELEGEGPGAKMLAAMVAYIITIFARPADEAVAYARRALADDVLIQADNGLFWVTANVVLVAADELEALEVWERALAHAHRGGSEFAVLTVNLWRGWTTLWHGDLAEAERSLRAAGEELERWGSPGEVNAYPVAFLAQALTERGDLAGARAVLERIPTPADDSDGSNFWRRSYIGLLLAEGRAEEALAVSDQHLVRLRSVSSPAWSGWNTTRGRVLDALGRREEAIAHLTEDLERARRWGSPGTVGNTLRLLGTIEREEGIEHLREAVAELERSTARLEHAKALAALGGALRRAGKRTEAREPLRQALELAAACGATPLVEDLRSELYATGIRPRTEALSGAEALTASEQRVAGLAAEGQTNRDIAQTLFVTPKTVEVHLTNAYRKLGIRSRRELAGALASPEAG